MSINYGSFKKLADTTLHATESIIYNPGTGSAEIASIWLHNRAAATATAICWFPFTATHPTGAFSASAAIQRFSESMTSSYTLEIAPKVPWVLSGSAGSGGEKLTMRATQTASINVIVFGREGTGAA